MKNICSSLRTIEGVIEFMGTFLLWNFKPGKFFSVSGIPLQSVMEMKENLENLIGPTRVKKWLINGRKPKVGKYESLVQPHYGAFYGLKISKNYKMHIDYLYEDFSETLNKSNLFLGGISTAILETLCAKKNI